MEGNSSADVVEDALECSHLCLSSVNVFVTDMGASVLFLGYLCINLGVSIGYLKKQAQKFVSEHQQDVILVPSSVWVSMNIVIVLNILLICLNVCMAGCICFLLMY